MTRTATTKKQKKCLGPGCKKTAMHRGLCAGCYQAAGRLVRSGAQTWERLEEIGLASDDGGKPVSPFLRAYRESQK
jgi:hypothetical protein